MHERRPLWNWRPVGWVIRVKTVLMSVKLVDVTINSGDDVVTLELIIRKIADHLVKLDHRHFDQLIVHIEREKTTIYCPGFFKVLNLR